MKIIESKGNIEGQNSKKTFRKRFKIIVIGILSSIYIIAVGYHFYCHAMVNQFFYYVRTEDTEAILAHIDKMPTVNMRYCCNSLYHIIGIMTQYAANNGYPLDYAVYEDVDVSVIEALLKRGADPNKKEMSGTSSPFQQLCSYSSSCKYEKIKVMMEYGATIDEYISLPMGMNFRELSERSKETSFRSIEFLWENGVKDIYGVGTKYESTQLHSAVFCLDTQYLSKLYHNEKRGMAYLLNVRNANGETPIFSAVRADNCDNCQFLLSEGADLDIRNSDGKTAYDIAVELEFEECAEVLSRCEK